MEDQPSIRDEEPAPAVGSEPSLWPDSEVSFRGRGPGWPVPRALARRARPGRRWAAVIVPEDSPPTLTRSRRNLSGLSPGPPAAATAVPVRRYLPRMLRVGGLPVPAARLA